MQDYFQEPKHHRDKKKNNVMSDATGEICYHKHEVVVKLAAAGEGLKEPRVQRAPFSSEPSRKA